MSESTFAQIFFIYGLAFFSMGLAILLELSRATDERLRRALRPLAAFGLIHGSHEWFEMFIGLDLLPFQAGILPIWEALRVGVLAFSFLSLAAFGSLLFATDERRLRVSYLVPLLMVLVWGSGLLVINYGFEMQDLICCVADVWTRYALGIPAGIIACAGLISQQRQFRLAGMARFGRDSLWAAAAFAWYGIIGQLFTSPSPLPPSTVINNDLFTSVFGFPVQLLRAVAAAVTAIFVIRFLRSFEMETRQQIAELQTERLRDAERRQELRGELLRRVVAAQEAERRRIARELHDETGQALTALAMGLRGVASALPIENGKAVENLHHLEQMSSQALDELQRLIEGLRPSHLDDLGLPAALRWYAGEIEDRGLIETHIELQGEEREITSEAKTVLFRVAQEALTNVVKHASASQAILTLEYQEEGVRLQVRDDGIGFELHAMDDTRPRWGLLGIQERVSLLGGTFNIYSKPDVGTTVNVTIPYRGEGMGEHGDSPTIGG